MIFKLINFLIFAGILVYFLRRPAKELILNRHKSIGETITAAGKTFETAISEKKLWNEKLNTAGKEISALTEELKREGDLERTHLVEQAKIYAEELKEDTQHIVKHETNKAISEIKAITANMVVDIVTKRLSKEITQDEHLKITTEAATEIEATL